MAAATRRRRSANCAAREVLVDGATVGEGAGFHGGLVDRAAVEGVGRAAVVDLDGGDRRPGLERAKCGDDEADLDVEQFVGRAVVDEAAQLGLDAAEERGSGGVGETLG
jgi:hypothetical protein